MQNEIEDGRFDPSRWRIGAMYRVPWSPNPHRLEEIRPQYCQLHGEQIGYHLCLRKRRNSEVRPWGSVALGSPDQNIELFSDSGGSPKGGDACGSGEAR